MTIIQIVLTVLFTLFFNKFVNRTVNWIWPKKKHYIITYQDFLKYQEDAGNKKITLDAMDTDL